MSGDVTPSLALSGVMAPTVEDLSDWNDLLQVMVREATGEALEPAPAPGTAEAALRARLLRAIAGWVAVCGVRYLQQRAAALASGDEDPPGSLPLGSSLH